MRFRQLCLTALLLTEASVGMASGVEPVGGNLPMVVDVGSQYCVPCRMMIPVLESISKRYEGRVVVRVIDIRKEPKAAEELDVHIIPTQIFFNRAGEEVRAHVGYMSEAEMISEIEKLL